MPSDLLQLIARDTPLRRTSAHDGGEYSGPCPLCRQGSDRFKVWPRLNRWACLGYEAGRAGCDVGGDAVQYLRLRDNLSYAAACAALGIEPEHGAAQPKPCAAGPGCRRPCAHEDDALTPPNPTWQARAEQFAADCAEHLWAKEGRKALQYLNDRGFDDQVLRAYGVGYQPADVSDARSLWGLPVDEHAKGVWLPRGVVLPCRVQGQIWRINVRRPLTAKQAALGEPKYMGPAGGSQALYNAAALAPGKPTVLVEGEFDALSIVQACGDAVAAVAAGSTGGGRRRPWLERLAQASVVLVAFDVDGNGAGDKAAGWWVDALPGAVRWKPLLHDVNAMLAAGVDVRQWVQAGIEQAEETR